MAAVRFLGTAPAGRLERVAGALAATSSLGARSTLPIGRVRPYSIRSVSPPGGVLRRGARTAGPSRAAMGGDLFALDFDGVFCDSCGESSLSAVKAAKVRWPWVFEQVDAAMEKWIVEQMYTLRPVVETGYENLLLVRLLVEIQIPSVRKSSVADGLIIQEILENWLKLKPTLMDEWQEDRESLVDLFGRSRFAEALLKELAGIDFPSERIYGLGTGPKVKVLQQLQQMPQHQGLTLHFIEDRLATLKNVIKEPALDKWNLYLVTWGYNTQKEREEAQGISRIQLVDLPDFSASLPAMAELSRLRRSADHRYRLRLRRRLLVLLPLALLLVVLAHLPALLLRRANSLGRRCLPAATDRLLLPRPVPGPRLSFAIVTLADEDSSASRGRRSFRGVLAATARNKRAYAAAHGYGLVALPASAVDPSRPPSWSKVLALRAHLRRHHWLFWNDADTLVTNPENTLVSL
ncbi:hypothetical protein BAE44_0011478 [Dichanthelium oligosanthes]|uniref:Uncharacterized protein n=1 Tax=Dichanthelium oligosanthes TaxID=888268 RepID=A0A1E5VQV6_9POAL|nr:hypothetical protein BAE44_0011478 [Dichanthelium oligosanthes]